jgi:hypothetical protein
MGDAALEAGVLRASEGVAATATQGDPARDRAQGRRDDRQEQDEGIEQVQRASPFRRRC